MTAPVLLLPGADTTAAEWSSVLLDGLRSGGYQPVLHDHPLDPATLHDLVGPALAALDQIGATSAHVVASSMGAMVAQLLALDHGERVRSLTLLITTATPGDPPPTPAYLAAAADLAFSDDAADPAAWARLLRGTRYPPAPTPAAPPGAAVAVSSHARAVEATPPWHDRLGAITAPTLVIHGSADPLFPPAHARYLAGAVPAATLRVLADLGHEVPDELFVEVLPLVLTHLAAAETVPPPA